MMNKEYITPTSEVVEIKVDDVMTVSNPYATPEIPIVGGGSSYKFD